MNSARAKAAVVLCLVCLAGCSRKDKNVVLPVEEAPVLPISTMANAPELPSFPTPAPPDVVFVSQEAEKQPASTPDHPHRPVRRKQKTTTTEEAAETTPTPAAQPETQARNTQPSDISPIGQLSTDNDNAGTPERHVIVDLIASTENGLKGITRTLSPDEQKTVLQIRTFLVKARDALKVDDLTGANTLATKAHLLLDELVKS
jgi:hypothetical protein